jgi:uncharacterized membrane protein
VGNRADCWIGTPLLVLGRAERVKKAFQRSQSDVALSLHLWVVGRGRSNECPGRGAMKRSETSTLPAADSVANIHAVAQMELDQLGAHTLVERLTERITAAASATPFIVAHLVWFAIWISLNTIGSWKFDPYPFSFLTLVVSLEAIVLTLFVLRDQARMSIVSDRRAHLDLQVNLLAEQELTAILQMMCGLSKHVGWDPHAENPNLVHLLRHTNVRDLANEINKELDPHRTENGGASDGSDSVAVAEDQGGDSRPTSRAAHEVP